MSASEADDEAKKLEEDRTNSMGFFNTAEAFRLSATALEASKVKIGHADKPIRVLTYQALELYLKAMLRQSHNTETIKRRFGHDTKRLMEEAEMSGFAVTDEDRDVLSRIADTDAVIEARYIRTGAKNWPTLEEVKRTCNNVRNSVGGFLLKSGVLVRLTDSR
jgi:HEPN domain.